METKRRKITDYFSKINFIDIFSNYDIVSHIFDFLDINDMMRLKLVSIRFKKDTEYYISYNKKCIPKLEKQYLFWFNKNLIYTKEEKLLKKKKEGRVLKAFFKKYLDEYKFTNFIKKFNLNRKKEQLFKCDCSSCVSKLHYLNSQHFQTRIDFCSLFYYDKSYKFINIFKDRILCIYANKLGKIISLDENKSLKILIMFLITRGIRYIYNAPYKSQREYCVNIKKWNTVERLYYILAEINNLTIKLLKDKFLPVEKIINSYFTTDECVNLLFRYMYNFISIHNKHKKSFINNFIN